MGLEKREEKISRTQPESGPMSSADFKKGRKYADAVTAIQGRIG